MHLRNAALVGLLAVLGLGFGQDAPGPAPFHAPEGIVWPTHVCGAADVQARESGRGSRAGHRPRLLDQVGETRPPALLMPVDGVRVAEVYPSFGDPRGGGSRRHIGLDIMAPRGTPVRPAAPGYVTRFTDSVEGGISVTLVGDGGVRYFYTHFDSLPPGMEVGTWVGIEDVIGFVGNTGNAAATAPHLHFEVHLGGLGEWCGWEPVDPLPLLVDRAPL